VIDKPTAVAAGVVLICPMQIVTTSSTLQIVRSDGSSWPPTGGDPYRILDYLAVEQHCSSNKALAIALLTLIIAISIAISPPLLAAPKIEFEVDPTPGSISDGVYDTQRRIPTSLTPVVFTIRIHNLGSAQAENIVVTINQTYSSESNFTNIVDFHTAEAFLPNLRRYSSPKNLASSFTIRILKAGDSGEVDFNFGINGTRFLQMRSEGTLSRLFVNIEYSGPWRPWYPSRYFEGSAYTVDMPGP
jgi:hypothetical protein